MIAATYAKNQEVPLMADDRFYVPGLKVLRRASRPGHVQKLRKRGRRDGA